MEQDTANSGEGFAPASWDTILRSEPASQAPAPAPEPKPAPEPMAAPETGEKTAEASRSDRPRDPHGRFAPKSDETPKPEAAPPAAAPQNQPPQSVPVSAVQEERRKRQALERELQDLRAKLATPQPATQQPAQPQAPQVPLPDLMFQDPAAFVQTLEQRMEQRALETRIATSEAIARQQPDYSDAEEALTAYAQSSPQAAQEVAQALRSHPAPAMWAYQAGKQLLAQQRWAPVMQQHTDPEAWIASEVERRIAERMQHQPAPTPAPSAAPPPPSLASVRSAGPRSGAAAWTGPTPASAIWGRR